MRNLLAVPCCIALLLCAAPACATTEETKQVKVGLFVNEPFVIDHGSGKYAGLAFNLWEMVAERLGLECEYLPYSSLKPLLEDAQNGKIDLVVGDIAANYDRAKHLKFSFPWYDDGQRILVMNHGTKLSTWDILQQRGQIADYAWILFCIVALAFAQALLRRSKDDDFPAGWLEGMSQSLYEVIRMAKAGILQKNFFGWAGYIVMTAWMLCGLGLLAYVTSTLTSAMAAANMQRSGDINSLNDLSGKRVAVLSHSVGEKYMRQTAARLVSFEIPEDARNALLIDDVDAVVDTAAVLEYWSHNHPKMDVEVVGNIFDPCKYAFVANKNHSLLLDLVSVEVIRLLSDGTAERLKDKYFGRVRF
jgi:ABC-type amino acid transport substrate-binding protein